MQTIESIINLLETSTFSDAADREYWENKLKEMKRKAETVKNNERYFEKMAMFDR